MIFRRRADHGRAADVDLLDGFFRRYSFAGRRGLEGIQVDHDQLESQDAVFGQARMSWGLS